MKRLIVLCLIILLITGCTNNNKEINKREVKDHILKCSSEITESKVKTKVNISIYYSNNKITKGKTKIEVLFPNDVEKEMLNTLNMCSTDVMTDLLEYGKCTTEVEDNKLESILTIDKEKIKKYNKNIKEIKEEIESNSNLNCKCTIE